MGSRQTPLAGPLWAEAGWDLYEAWVQFYTDGGFVPFDQTHGHSSAVGFDDQTWRCPGRVRQRAAADWQDRHVRVRIGGRTFMGVGPKHGRTGAAQWRPPLVNNADVLVGVGRVDYGVPSG